MTRTPVTSRRSGDSHASTPIAVVSIFQPRSSHPQRHTPSGTTKPGSSRRSHSSGWTAEPPVSVAMLQTNRSQCSRVIVGDSRFLRSRSAVISGRGFARATTSMSSACLTDGTAKSWITMSSPLQPACGTRRPTSKPRGASFLIRERVSSNSPPGSPAVEIAMSCAPRFSSLPRHVRYSFRSRWRWSSSTSASPPGMMPSPVRSSAAIDLDAPAGPQALDPPVAVIRAEARTELGRAGYEALGLAVHDLRLLAARRRDRDHRAGV
jgi:hypothetical protein